MSRKNITLIHGWGANVTKLKPLSDILEDMGWKVCTPGLPGFDITPSETVWGLAEYAGYVLSQSQKYFFHKKFVVFGHSFGGRIAIKLGLLYPGYLQGIALCATSGISRPSIIKRRVFHALARFGKTVLVNNSLSPFYKKVLYKLARVHDYEKADGVMKSIFRKIIDEDLSSQISKLKTPIIVFWGKKDRMTAIRDAYIIKKAQPEAKLVIFEKEGHRLPYQKPRQIAKELEKWIRYL